MAKYMNAPLLAVVFIATCCTGLVSGQNGGQIELPSYEIFVDIVDGDSMSIMIEPDDAVQDLRMKIDVAMPSERKRLSLGETSLDGRVKRLSAYNVTPGSRITMILEESEEDRALKNLNVTKLNGEVISLQFQIGNTVASLKDYITEKTGIPQAEQRLLLRGQELKNERRLSQYAVFNRTILNLGKPLEDCQRMGLIILKTLNGGVIKMEVNLYDTVGSLQAKIRDTTGVALAALHLFFGHQRLRYRDNHLCDYGIEDGSTLYLVLHNWKIETENQVEQLKPVPTTPKPDYQAPIFREAGDAPGPDYSAIYRDSGNWMLGYWDQDAILAAMTPTAYLAVNPDGNLPDREKHQGNSEYSAQIVLASNLKPYRTPLKGRDEWNNDERAGIRVGYGVTRRAVQDSQGADLTNYAPDKFTEADVMRLFEVSERVRQLLDKGAQTGRVRLSVKKQREINENVLSAYLEALVGFPIAHEFNKSEQVTGSEECPVCRDNLTSERWIKLPCKHAYHVSCMLEWSRKERLWATSQTCIYCKNEFFRSYDVVGEEDLRALSLLE